VAFILAQMGFMISCGVAWRIIRPGGLDADHTRLVLTTLVFNGLMPALVFTTLSRADLGAESLKISLFTVLVILFGAAMTWLASPLFRVGQRQMGAALLAVAFPNVTYLGLPLLEHLFGAWTRSLVIQVDLFAATPMVLTVGVLIARHYGDKRSDDGKAAALALLLNPPLLAAVLAVGMNLGGMTAPGWLAQALEKLGSAVVPLMLISLGLGLRWNAWQWRNIPAAGLVLILKLLLMPALGLVLATALGVSGQTLTALVMEAGMPSMLFGVVYCDRYRLDTAFYAMLVTITTLASLASLPLWHDRAWLP